MPKTIPRPKAFHNNKSTVNILDCMISLGRLDVHLNEKITKLKFKFDLSLSVATSPPRTIYHQVERP
jgi:hypothetical protein